MDYNLHTHTWRCSHATGAEEEYILRAIENGIVCMGFSDHIPFRCADGYEAVGTRIPMAQAAAYAKAVPLSGGLKLSAAVTRARMMMASNVSFASAFESVLLCISEEYAKWPW